jgi:TPR repeat protein
LGIAYLVGYGVQKDLTDAISWLKESAEHGCADAQATLGIVYVEGLRFRRSSTTTGSSATHTNNLNCGAPRLSINDKHRGDESCHRETRCVPQNAASEPLG